MTVCLPFFAPLSTNVIRCPLSRDNSVIQATKTRVIANRAQHLNNLQPALQYNLHPIRKSYVVITRHFFTLKVTHFHCSFFLVFGDGKSASMDNRKISTRDVIFCRYRLLFVYTIIRHNSKGDRIILEATSLRRFWLVQSGTTNLTV